MNSKVTFNKSRFEESDQKAKDAVRKLYKELFPSWTLEDNEDKYGIDFLVYEDGELIAYIECELSFAGFEKGRFKYEQIRLLPRKNHYLDGVDSTHKKLQNVPIYLATVSVNCDSVLVYEMRDMKRFSRLVTSLNKVPYKQEPVLEQMYSLDLAFTKTYSLN